jgi:hypothetical protein
MRSRKYRYRKRRRDPKAVSPTGWKVWAIVFAVAVAGALGLLDIDRVAGPLRGMTSVVGETGETRAQAQFGLTATVGVRN